MLVKSCAFLLWLQIIMNDLFSSIVKILKTLDEYLHISYGSNNKIQYLYGNINREGVRGLQILRIRHS